MTTDESQTPGKPRSRAKASAAKRPAAAGRAAPVAERGAKTTGRAATRTGGGKATTPKRTGPKTGSKSTGRAAAKPRARSAALGGEGTKQRVRQDRREARQQSREAARREEDMAPTDLPPTAPPPNDETPAMALNTPAPQAAEDATHFSAGPVDLLTAEEERMFSRTTRWSFIFLVLLPLLAAGAYLFAVAADRYAVEVKFAVRSPTGLPASDLIGMVTGGAASTTRSDAYMVVEYLQSRQFLDEVTTRLDLPAIYATDLADPLMRLAPDASKEDQVDYLTRVVHPSFDATAEIITVEAQAFTQDDALRVASAVLETAEAMVNRLSEQARRDTVRLAEAELGRAEAALKAQRAAIAAFRESEQSIDPNQTVATQENVLRDLQSQLATAQAEMRSLREFLSSEAPSIRVLNSRIASIENQIAQERANLGRGRAEGDAIPSVAGAETLNSAVSLYEALAVDLEFHERTYVSALSSLEAARLEADRQQRYLAAVVLPSLPESPTYPRVFLTLALVFSVCFFTWGILSMFIHVIREHMR